MKALISPVWGMASSRARPALLWFCENRADVYLSIGTDHDVGEKFSSTHFSDDGMLIRKSHIDAGGVQVFPPDERFIRAESQRSINARRSRLLQSESSVGRRPPSTDAPSDFCRTIADFQGGILTDVGLKWGQGKLVYLDVKVAGVVG